MFILYNIFNIILKYFAYKCHYKFVNNVWLSLLSICLSYLSTLIIGTYWSIQNFRYTDQIVIFVIFCMCIISPFKIVFSYLGNNIIFHIVEIILTFCFLSKPIAIVVLILNIWPIIHILTCLRAFYLFNQGRFCDIYARWLE